MAQPDRLHLLSAGFCFLLIALLSTIRICIAFNLDVQFPVIKDGKTKDSFFGLSVALHKQTKGASRYLLLTGAPKEKAQPQLRVNETGAVYSCPITIDPSDCSRMDLVSSVAPNEIVEGMWLGVTVASQKDQWGGRVLACGHRYVKVVGPELSLWRMVGKCYVRGNDLTYDPTDYWQTFPYENCNPDEDHDREGLCNMGISGGISHTDVYIGSPGSFNWEGNVHVTWRNPVPEDSWDSRTKSFPDFGKKSYSYMGYSVTEEKNLLSMNEYTVVTGSPRDDNRGSVTLAKIEDTLAVVLILNGEQVGSYFGNCIATTDLNSDGWNDLLVGAPFYFDRKGEKGGAVYVYMNENGSFRTNPSMTLFGFAGSAFGMSVAAIGDINQDGFQDFAVGAPFHGTGKVFVWMGSQKGIAEEPSQVIEGKDVGNGGFQTFGYSINGGMDMDQNKYPDVLVGSLDNRIALLRARPVIHLNKTFIVEPVLVDPSQCSSDSCVTVKVCFSYTLSNGDKDFKEKITVKYTVKADSARRSSRLRFVDKQDEFIGFLSIQPSSTCQELKLSVVEPLRDKLQPVVFSLSVSLDEGKPSAPQALQNLDSFPVLDKDQQVVNKTEIHFQMECGSDNKCSSNLQLRATFASEQQVLFPSEDGHQVMQYNSGVKKLMVLVNVTNLPAPGKLAEDAHQALLNLTVPSALHFFGVRSSDKEVECRVETTVLCELGNPFKSNHQANILIIFETSGISLYTQEIQSTLQLSTLSEQSDLDPQSIALMVEYTLQTTFAVVPHKTQAEFSGTVMGESAMKSFDDIGSPVEYTFTVNVLGMPLGTMGNLEVEFLWPYEVANGKWLLYPTEILTNGVSDSHCIPPGDIVNPLRLNASESNARRKREVDGSEPRQIEPLAANTLRIPQRKNIVLDCELGKDVKCVKFSCPLQNMNNSAEVIVRARVWNSTMLEDYIDDRITVKGLATLKLVTDRPALKMDSATRKFVLDIDPKVTDKPLYQAPMWIIIVSVLAGVLLLALIILMLWKCGFFKRAIYYRLMPKYHGVKIRKEERYQLSQGFLTENPSKKHWVTNWTEIHHLYY
ncbi:integrin alpha-3-like isoform X1 [Anguilla anguilla]|uniref:integrin alpha-3-like isoform X1 n=1 Tax=Anguilla anguilla TaxID=7936 RepID=UPI0015B1BB45|nr:integrin alpha-3-like isoform X1 [Anguilla anguilla]